MLPLRLSITLQDHIELAEADRENINTTMDKMSKDKDAAEKTANTKATKKTKPLIHVAYTQVILHKSWCNGTLQSFRPS